jgi:hypothetical protein
MTKNSIDDEKFLLMSKNSIDEKFILMTKHSINDEKIILVTKNFVCCVRQVQIGYLVDRLWWGETDISELRPLRAYCSFAGDLQCVPWYDGIDWGKLPVCLPERSGSPQYCPAALPRHVWSEWESGLRKWEFSLFVPVGLQEIFNMP